MQIRGFSLIELMVVVAIVAILGSVAVPAYQDYVRRVRVAEAIALVSGVKMQIAENAMNGKAFKSGLVLPKVSGYLKEVVVDQGSGLIELKFLESKFNGVAYNLLIVPKDSGLMGSTLVWELTGTASGSKIPEGTIMWGCRSAETPGGWVKGSLPGKYAPEYCRETLYNENPY